VERFVLAEVVRVVGLAGASRVDPGTELSALGVDSLMLLELKNRLEASTGLTIAIQDLLGAGTPRGVARLMHGLLTAEGGPRSALVPEVVGAAEEGEL
jgi:acyl carrier protein